MLRKVVTILMLMSVVLCFGKDFKNVKETRVISKSENKVVFERDGMIHRMSFKKSVNALGKTVSEGVLDTIVRFTPPRNASYYHDGMAGHQNNGSLGGLKDTVIKRFRLIAPGFIKKVMMQNKHEGTAELQFWGPSIYSADGWRYSQFPETQDESSGVIIPGAHPYLPYSAQLFCDAQDPDDQFNDLGEWIPQWNVFDMDELYGDLNPFLSGDSMELWVGYVTDGISGPTIFQDDESMEEQKNITWDGNTYSWSTLKIIDASPGAYYYFASTNEDDSKNVISHIMQIIVEYPAVPPFIENVTELSNMYTKTATVKADIFDKDSESFTAQIQYKVGSNGEKQFLDMAATGNGDEYVGTLTGEVGDTIFYVVKADDGELSQFSSTNYKSYTIKEKPEGKDILVIREGKTKNDSLYNEVLDVEKTLYWIMEDEGGLHKSVVSVGYDVIFVTGFGTTVVPIFDEEDNYGFSEHLENGGTLVLCDPDWAYANELVSDLYVTLEPGDFAYDYFGIDTLINDPADDKNESIADDQFDGISGNPISGDFTGGVTYGPLIYNILGKTNWGDFAYPNDSETSMTFFTGSNNKYPAAVGNATGKFRTLYCGFWPEVIATEQFNEFKTLISNVLNSYTFVDKEISNVATEFSLSQNFPNPFNPTTNIEFSIPEKSFVSLKIYDMNGKLVRRLSNGTKNQGRYLATWDAKNEFGFKVASGVYFYKLQTSNNVVTKKMLLMK